MKKNTVFSLLIFIIFLIIIFRNWFFSAQIIGGDWPYFYDENVSAFSFLPPAWNSLQGNGLGGQSLSYSLDSYLYFTGWLFSSLLHVPWAIVYKVFWFGMFIILSSLSLYKLQNKLFPTMKFIHKLLGSFIYTTNTYILMVVGGGQMGVALGYAIAPFILLQFIKLLDEIFVPYEKNNLLNNSIVAGVLLAVLIMFDIRMAYVTLLAIVIYFLLKIRNINRTMFIKTIFYVFFSPSLITLLLHAFWLLPFFFIGNTSVSQLGAGYTSIDSVKFFSFATFENAFGLLHPNWPENIFGKVGFMKAEFLLLPIIAYASLLFVNILAKVQKKNQKKMIITSLLQQNSIILFFCLLGLIGIFLAKGANDPFGGIYVWLFTHIPGFVMFRDPTKFYTLIALVYSVLIPFSLWRLGEHFPKFKAYSFIIFIAFLIFWLWLIKPAVGGELGGTFAHHAVPEDYIQLKKVLLKNPEFSRTLWLPKMQRYGFVNQNHPAVEMATIFKATNSAQMIKALKEKGVEKKLVDLSIQYVIVPIDAEGEIFLKDRKYNAAERKMIIDQIQTIPWLKKDITFKNLVVYSVQQYKDKFWTKEGGTITYQKNSDTNYTIDISSNAETTIIMAESFNPYWVAQIGDNNITSKRFDNLNSFEVPVHSQNKKIQLSYSLDRYYSIGQIISGLALIVTFLFLLRNKRWVK